MTDVESKTPTKRRLPEKKSPASAKKQKISPKKQDKKLNKSNNVQNNNEKIKGNKKNDESKNGSPKKLKSFVGTSKIASNEHQTEDNKKVVKQNKKTEGKSEGRKPRRSPFAAFRDKIKNSDEKEVALKSIEEKIKAIESRGQLTKSAKRKLKVYIRLKRLAGGELDDESQSQKVSSNKPEQKSHKEGKKKGIDMVKTAQVNQGKKNQVVKTAVKGPAKANELNKKQATVGNKQVTKKVKQSIQVIEKEESSDEDEESENELEENESGSDEEVDDEHEGVENDDDSGDEEEGDEEESDDEDGEEEEESDEDESEEESPPPQEEKSSSKMPIKNVEMASGGVKNKEKSRKIGSGTVNLENLKNNKLVVKNQKRFVLFVGNIPYDTNKQDLIEHFKKCGEIKHIRIPTEKKSSKPRGFAYVEVGNEESYQKCLSMHHTILKSRRINVLYTQGGKKKGEEKKKEIKAKNFKLHAMRKEGKLVGSKKENQRRSFRRAKSRAHSNQGETQD